MKKILLPFIFVLAFSCTKNTDNKTAQKNVKSDVDNYCEFVTELVNDPKYKKNPILHLKKFQEFRTKGISKPLAQVLSFLSKTPKPKRYEIFIKAARKMKRDDKWDCPKYKEYTEKF